MTEPDLLASIALRTQNIQDARRTEECEHTQRSQEAQESIADENDVDPTPRDPASMSALSDELWSAWMQAVNSDSLLVILLDAPDALRERVVASLDQQSQIWMQENLALLGSVTAALARESWQHAWEKFDHIHE